MSNSRKAAEGVKDTTAAQEIKTELSAAVAEKYNLKGIKPGRYHFPKFGEVDLTSMTLAKADNLVKRGFTYLQAKNKKAADQDAIDTVNPEQAQP